MRPMLTSFLLTSYIMPKDRLEAAFLKKLNESTQPELSFCADKPAKRGGNTLFAKR